MEIVEISITHRSIMGKLVCGPQEFEEFELLLRRVGNATKFAARPPSPLELQTNPGPHMNLSRYARHSSLSESGFGGPVRGEENAGSFQERNFQRVSNVHLTLKQIDDRPMEDPYQIRWRFSLALRATAKHEHVLSDDELRTDHF